MESLRTCDDFLLLGNLPILVKETGLDVYDFPFRSTFACRSVVYGADRPVLLRMGAIADYTAVERNLEELGMRLLVTQEAHDRVSLLENWYPLLQEHTPRSRVYAHFPPMDELLEHFRFPVFIKGSRQTSGHRRSQCIIQSAAAYGELQKQWSRDRLLHWQRVAIREFVPLQTVDDTSYPDQVPFSYEFRVFFWKGILVGCGRYWQLGKPYTLQPEDREPALALAKWAAERVDAPFLAVDVAKTSRGEWTLIEVNDGQESGYAGVNPALLWRNVMQLEASE